MDNAPFDVNETKKISLLKWSSHSELFFFFFLKLDGYTEAQVDLRAQIYKLSLEQVARAYLCCCA